MAIDYSTTALLASIRRRAMLPSASSSGTADADLLAFANEELQHRLMADIMAIREEYFVRNSDVTLVAGRTEYRIPSRAVGATLRDVSLVNGNGDVFRLPRITPERLDQFNGQSGAVGYYIRSSSVILVGSTDSSATTLRMSFFVRPSELMAVGTPGAARITGIAGNVVTVASTTGLTSGALDLMAATAPFEHLALDQTPASTTATTLTFSSSLPVTLSVGDYVTVADKSVIPNIPAEWHPILAQRVAVKVLEALGDVEGARVALVSLQEMEDKAKVLVTPRVEGSLEKIINRSTVGRSVRSRWN